MPKQQFAKALEELVGTKAKVGKQWILVPHQTEPLQLMFSTGAVSTHNISHRNVDPRIAEMLVAYTLWWITEGPLRALPHHVVAYGQDIYNYFPMLRNSGLDVHRRAFVSRILDMIPIEFIGRIRNDGSLWRALERGEDPYGLGCGKLPRMYRFDTIELTPTRKSKNDEPLKHKDVRAQYPHAVGVWSAGGYIARQAFQMAGFELIDYKVELGRYHLPGIPMCMFADELLTPYTTRVAPFESIKIGKQLDYHDKEILRIEAELSCGGRPTEPIRFSDEAMDRFISACNVLFLKLTHQSIESFKARLLA